MLINGNPPSKMKLFWCQGFFFNFALESPGNINSRIILKKYAADQENGSLKTDFTGSKTQGSFPTAWEL